MCVCVEIVLVGGTRMYMWGGHSCVHVGGTCGYHVCGGGTCPGEVTPLPSPSPPPFPNW